MRNAQTTYLILLLFLCIALHSCDREQGYIQTLKEIQRSGDGNPLAALKALEPISRDIEQNGNRRTRMKCALLKTRLRDKAYICSSSASTIKEVCDYFESHGTPGEKAEAYYYLGSSYRDLQDYPQAVTAFNKAIESCIPTKEGEVMICSNAYSQLINLYVKQLLYDDALSCALEELDLMKRHGLADPTSYMDVATGYFFVNDPAHALAYCDSTLAMIRKSGNIGQNASIVAELMWQYAEAHQHGKSKTCHAMLEKLPEGERPGNYLLCLGKYYTLNGMDAPALALYESLYENATDLTQIRNSARFLMDHSLENGEYESFTRYARRFLAANDSLAALQQKDLTARACGESIYRRNMEKEKEALEELSDLNHAVMALLALIVAGTLIGTWLYVRRERRNSNILLAKDMELLDLTQAMVYFKERQKEYEAMLTEKKKEINEKNRTIAEKERERAGKLEEMNRLEQAKATIEQECAALKEQIAEKEQSLTRLKMDKRAAEKLVSLLSDSEKATENLEKVRQAAQGIGEMTNKDWQQLRIAVEKMHPGFDAAVHSRLRRVSDSALQTCYLLKVGLTNPEIIHVQKLPRQTVWNRVKRIREDLGELLE